SSLPRSPAHESSILLRGTMSRGFGAARVVVTAPDGSSRAPHLVSATDGSFHAVVPLSGGAGRFQVEILGSGPDGPEILANFPLFVGKAPPDRLLMPRPASRVLMDAKEAARTLWGLLALARKRAGAPPLSWHPELAEVARAHSFDMCRRQAVHHHSPESGTAADRVARARLSVTWVGENVGHAASPDEADRAMMQSPGHRAMRLGSSATHGGIGVCVLARDGGQELYVTELFVRMGASPR
ncbi:MAG: CAP domain-containing protein, partial [Polyangia bacterium]|nr:CAP domain-containing protein [Polyangia bacterium]